MKALAYLHLDSKTAAQQTKAAPDVLRADQIFASRATVDVPTLSSEPTSVNNLGAQTTSPQLTTATTTPARMEQTTTTAEKSHSCKVCRKATRTGKGNGCRGYVGETKHQLLERKIRNDSTDLKEEEILQCLRSIKKSVRGGLHTGLRQVTDQTQGFDEAEKSLSRLSQLWEETADMSLLPKILRAQEAVECERQKVSGRESVCRRALKGLNGEERRAIYDKHADVTCSHDVDILRQKYKNMLSQGTVPGDSIRTQLLDITKGIAKLESKLSKAAEDDDEQFTQPARRATAFVHEGVSPEEDPLRAAEIDWVCRRVAAGGLPEYKMSEKSRR